MKWKTKIPLKNSKPKRNKLKENKPKNLFNKSNNSKSNINHIFAIYFITV